LTGGPKFLSLVLYIVAMRNYKKVKDIVYVREDIHEIVSFPKCVSPDFLTNFEKEIISTLIKCGGQCTTKELALKLNKRDSQVLRYLLRLKDKGIIVREKQSNKRIVKLLHNFL